jgi:hypothetical protein
MQKNPYLLWTHLTDLEVTELVGAVVGHGM